MHEKINELLRAWEKERQSIQKDQTCRGYSITSARVEALDKCIAQLRNLVTE